jgi:Domain of unknown function (DUF6285)
VLDERPTAAELLAAVADFLDREVRPALDGRIAFHTKVAVNVLRTVERELAAGPAFVAAERARLRALTGSDGDLHTQNALLASRIRTGELSIADVAVRDHLVRSVLSRLAIDNPRYPSLEEAARYWPLP